MLRVVFDTNVLIDGFKDDFSVEARLIDAVREGNIEAVVTRSIVKGYRKILKRLINNTEYKIRISEFMVQTQNVWPSRVDVEIEDSEDVKFLQAAVGGNADFIITNDRHLLDLEQIGSLKIFTPQEAWRMYQDEDEKAGPWSEWMKSLGIGS